MSFKNIYNLILKKILKSINTDHRQYPRCRSYHGHRRRVRLQIDGYVEKAEAEAVERMMNYCSASARRKCTWPSSSAPWFVAATSVAACLSRGADTTPCTSCWPP